MLMSAQISLREALPLVAQIERMIREKQAERSEKSVVRIDKGEQHEKTADVDNLTEEIRRLQRDLRTLQVEIQKANLTTHVEFQDENGEKLLLADAILLVKQMREELEHLRQLAAKPEKPVAVRGVGIGRVYAEGPAYEVATFDVDKYKNAYKSLQRKANALSNAIERANFDAMINFDASEYIEGV